MGITEPADFMLEGSKSPIFMADKLLPERRKVCFPKVSDSLKFDQKHFKEILRLEYLCEESLGSNQLKSVENANLSLMKVNQFLYFQHFTHKETEDNFVEKLSNTSVC